MSDSENIKSQQKLTFVLPFELHAELSQAAHAERRTLSGMTRLLLEEALIARSESEAKAA